MTEGIKNVIAVIDEIENNITEEIDHKVLASKLALSVFEFRRIFAFIVGYPISDYIRYRRLSLAAYELISNPDLKVEKVAEKYGYSTGASFSKAFYEFHGISPIQCKKGRCEIKIFTRPTFDFVINGRNTSAFTVENDDEFVISGLSAISPHSDTCCCDAVWEQFYAQGYDSRINDDKIYASYDNNGEIVSCVIGARNPKENYTQNSVVTIPRSKWVCFKMNTTDEISIGKKYWEILFEIFPSSKMKRREDVPALEIFPFNMEEENYEWEIRIPIE